MARLKDTPKCRDCKRRLGKVDGCGYCTRCAMRHRCGICSHVRLPRYMFNGSTCWGCQVRVVERIKAVNLESWICQPESAELDAAHEERLKEFERRAAAGLPLFGASATFCQLSGISG